MLWGQQRQLSLRILLFLSLLVISAPGHADVLPLDAKTKALAHYIVAVCHDLNGESAQAIGEYQKSVKLNSLS